MNFTETTYFHMLTQSLLAFVGYHEFRRDRYFLTRVTGAILAGLAACDFLIGVHTDFAHLNATPSAYSTFMAELLKAYLFINVIYVSRCAPPEEFCFLKDCIKPLLAATVIQSAQESQSLNMLRPLLIGVIPTVATAFQEDVRAVSPHMVLWFRVALPMYSARYLVGTQKAWHVFIGWLFYHTFYLGIRVFHG